MAALVAVPVTVHVTAAVAGAAFFGYCLHRHLQRTDLRIECAVNNQPLDEPGEPTSDRDRFACVRKTSGTEARHS